jgi:nickel-type superoxide dismutase maturation protease
MHRSRRWGTVLVAGSSMEPALRQGDMLLVAYGARIHPADVVVVALPGHRPLSVKRAVQHAAERWWLEGDNAAASTDSRSLGWIADEAVLGRVVLRYWPRPRRVS